jgi:hypothetical protein
LKYLGYLKRKQITRKLNKGFSELCSIYLSKVEKGVSFIKIWRPSLPNFVVSGRVLSSETTSLPIEPYDLERLHGEQQETQKWWTAGQSKCQRQ